MTIMLSKTTKLKIGVLAAFVLTVGQELSVFAANSSVIISENVTCDDIKALRNNSSNFALYFDPPHARKKPHFEVNAILSDQQRQNLGKDHSQTFSKFRFGTKPVQNNKDRLKFEVSKYEKNLTKGIEAVMKNAKNMTPVNNICQ